MVQLYQNCCVSFCFVIDDSMLQRTKGKEVELMARHFDHVSRSFIKGFNLLQLAWTDGVSIFPVNSALMSSSKNENRYGQISRNQTAEAVVARGVLRQFFPKQKWQSICSNRLFLQGYMLTTSSWIPGSLLSLLS